MKDQLKRAIIDGNQGVTVVMTSALLATGADGYAIPEDARRAADQAPAPTPSSIPAPEEA